jgi:hypothetical protein
VDAVWLDYQRPGFDMSKRIAELLDEHPSARAVLLERHGLVTWGRTSEEAYRSTIEFVTRAAEAVSRAAIEPPRLEPNDGLALVSAKRGCDWSRCARGARSGRGGAMRRARPGRHHHRHVLEDAGLVRRPGRGSLPRPPREHEAPPLVVGFDPATDDAAPSPTPSDAESRSTARGIARTTRRTSTTRRAGSRSTRSARGSP